MIFMTMGEYIKRLRTGENKYEKIWTQAELGQALVPPVNRAAVNRWEKGHVENIKRSYIQQLADLFGVNPTELMCFSYKYDEEQISEETDMIEKINKLYGKEVVQMIQYMNQLNDAGKEKALENIADLTELTKYTEA